MEEDTDAPKGQLSPRASALGLAIRAARGVMPQMEFTAHANRPQSVVSEWETGKKTPSLEALCALEQSLGLPLGTLAAQAGYVTPEAVSSLGISTVSISTLVFDRRSDAFEAVRAADRLGLGVRLSSMPGFNEDRRPWVVEVLPIHGGADEV